MKTNNYDQLTFKYHHLQHHRREGHRWRCMPVTANYTTKIWLHEKK